MAKKEEEKSDATGFSPGVENRDEKSESEKQLEKIKKLLKTIPQSSGVYKMKDINENIIYIGKAKNLKHRVAQYFQLSKAQSLKVKKMIEKIHDIDYIETDSEMEALILETNLIKENRPRYNILMKDDKNYVYIKVSVGEDYPRVSIIRQREKDGSIYFGPRTSVDSTEKLLNILRKIFPIRTCTLEMRDGAGGLIDITKKTIPVPCLDYHIKRCAGPCINEIKKDEYKEMIKQIINFLKGNYQELMTRLKYHMFNLAKDKKFELAAKTRDQVKSLEAMFDKKQNVSSPEFINRDVIGIHPDFDKTFINLFQFREGKLITQENFTLETPQNVSVSSDEEQTSSIIETFLSSYYTDSTDIPPEIFLRDPPLEQDLWQEWLTERRHEIHEGMGDSDRKKVHFISPIRGRKNNILALSEKNAGTFARQSRAKWMSDTAKTTKATKDLADELGFEKELKRIECYDISHLGGEHTTASMVVFSKGSPDKKQYRHFKLKTLENGEIDDYAALDEILSRRLQRLAQFSNELEENYTFKKPLKKDFELITKALRDEKLIRKKETPDLKKFVGVYYDSEGDNHLIGFAQIIEHNNGDTIQLGYNWIEEEHNTRALRHQLWSKLIEKIKAPRIYSSCSKEQIEDYLSYGFTELKKVPDFIKTKEKGKSYLIFKIKKKTKADDSFSQIPDLIIIDGGKGQLGIAHKIIQKSGLDIPVIGLAKKEEEIFMPRVEEDEMYQRIVLPKNSQALYLVQRLRDESHRFANELRKKLGKKKLTESAIDDIPSIGLIIKRRLLKEYGSINAIKSAPMEDLERVVGAYIAKMLKEKLGDTSK